MFMTGKELKTKVLTTGHTITEISSMLGMSPQALNTIFNVADVKTGTVEKMCAALKVDMSFFYPVAPAYEQTTNNTKEVHARNIGAVGSGNGTDNEGANAELINKLLEQLDAQRKQIDKLTDNNQKLMDKLLG